MSKIRHILSVIHYKIRGAVCFQLTCFSCDDWENTYILSYYHHQIGSMNYYPLFRARSWNNGVRCMSFCILIHMGLYVFNWPISVLGDWKDISIAHVIIIIKFWFLTFGGWLLRIHFKICQHRLEEWHGAELAGTHRKWTGVLNSVEVRAHVRCHLNMGVIWSMCYIWRAGLSWW